MELFHARRLLTHADFMENLDNDKIELTNVGHSSARMWTAGQEIKELECGTTGCVLGWAPFNPAFEGSGLKMVAHGGWSAGVEFTPITVADTIARKNDKTRLGVEPLIRAGLEFFGLDEQTARSLFYRCDVYDGCGTRWKGTNKQIANKLREVAYEKFPELKSESVELKAGEFAESEERQIMAGYDEAMKQIVRELLK